MSNLNLPIVLAISGASGTIYGLRTLQVLLENNYNVELIISENAIKVAKDELDLNLSTNPEFLKEQVLSYLKLSAFSSQLQAYSHNDISASISSGSYKTNGMIIIPASMGTIGAIASCTSHNLITRAADVCLKEKRKLVLVPREMPLSSIHLENLLKLSRVGAVVAPACGAFYQNPKSLDDMISFIVGKVLDQFEVNHNIFKRWTSKSLVYE
ncbi:MAG: UbiX family flavin prenyltransferase [Candidatus Melainabacteria bacterium]|nr:UbiX family flavin prenyltransferase [Candidatus Melainabacteria bacterium]